MRLDSLIHAIRYFLADNRSDLLSQEAKALAPWPANPIRKEAMHAVKKYVGCSVP